VKKRSISWGTALLLIALAIVAARAVVGGDFGQGTRDAEESKLWNDEWALVLQQDLARYQGAQDTYISSRAPEHRPHQRDRLLVRGDGSAQALLRFELGFLAPTTRIAKAELKLYVQTSERGPLSVAAYPLRRPWEISRVDWYDASSMTYWALPGAGAIDLDRVAEPVGLAKVAASEQWIALDLTETVQTWISEPPANWGVILQGRGLNPEAEIALVTSDSRQREQRPKLEIVLMPQVRVETEAGVMATPTPHASPTTRASVLPAETPTWVAPTLTLTPITTVPSVTPETVVMQNGLRHYRGAEDTYLSAWAPETTFGDSDTLFLRGDGAKRILLRFEDLPVPTDASVRSAELALYRLSPSAEMRIRVCPVDQAWDDHQASWQWALVGQRWSVPGGRSSCHSRGWELGSDRWLRIRVTPFVQEWVQSPGTNRGLLLIAYGDQSVQTEWASAEYWELAKRPRLRIDYVEPDNS
jgi:hypothetical protein